eukprot:TRINITY_DN8359_c0_g1_i1.p1 TRINITY_DN8359_c0_g1~~TRINITY_DN8359_c0_g1_i1.p1  ORF type:complete len:224 (+),score=57.47 TRINITY_DN8359_c0_g1_i1:46-717(+)
MLVRGGRLAAGRRTCIELTWARLIPGKDRIEPGPRGLPADMPKFPDSIADPDKGKHERPYHNVKDYEVWEAKFRKWLETARDTVTDGGGKPIALEPYQCFKAFEEYKEKLLKMSDEEKKLLGHTMDYNRVKPAHEMFGKKYVEMEESAVHLRRDSKGAWLAAPKAQHPPTRYFKDGKNVIGWHEAERICYQEKPINYMQELRDAIAARKKPAEEQKEAEKISG